MSNTAELAIIKLLTNLFSAGELRRFVSHDEQLSVLRHELPGANASLMDLATSVVEKATSRGLVNADLQARLEAERPYRKGDIWEAFAPLLPKAGGSAPGPSPSARSTPGPGPSPSQPWDVFLSHVSADKPIVEAIYDQIRATRPDLRVFFDKRGILPTEDWEASIDLALDQCRLFVAFVSSGWSGSRYTKGELATAVARKPPIGLLPVRLDDRIQLPLALRGVQQVDATGRAPAAFAPEIIAALP